MKLQTTANDLQSFLALSIKRELLTAIHDGCPALQDNPEQQKTILAKYTKFGEQVCEWCYLPHSFVIYKRLRYILVYTSRS